MACWGQSLALAALATVNKDQGRLLSTVWRTHLSNNTTQMPFYDIIQYNTVLYNTVLYIIIQFQYTSNGISLDKPCWPPRPCLAMFPFSPHVSIFTDVSHSSDYSIILQWHANSSQRTLHSGSPTDSP